MTKSAGSAGRHDVSIVLPTFNEADNIVPLVRELERRFSEQKIDLEILVVDDRSPDGTADLVRNAFGENGNVRVIVRDSQPGLAVSIRDGIERSTGNVVLVMDTDFNHKPADALFIYQVAACADLAIGSRFIFGGGMSNRARYYLSYLYNIFMRLTLGTRMDDNLSGLFAIKRDALARLDFDKIFWGYGDYFFRLLLLSQRHRLTHVQVPVFYGERLGGESKTRFVAIFLKYTKEVVRLVYLRTRGKW